MRTIFILKMITEQGVGYYDGNFNWSADLSKAEKYGTYSDAEYKAKKLFEDGSSGFMQIEKYFISNQ